MIITVGSIKVCPCKPGEIKLVWNQPISGKIDGSTLNILIKTNPNNQPPRKKNLNLKVNKNIELNWPEMRTWWEWPSAGGKELSMRLGGGWRFWRWIWWHGVDRERRRPG